MWVIQETVGHTNLDIYVLLLSFGRYLCRWTHLVDISTGGHIWSISLPVDTFGRYLCRWTHWIDISVGGHIGSISLPVDTLGRYLCRWTHLVDISAGGHIGSISLSLDAFGRYLCRWTINLEGIIRPVVSVSELTCIRYIYV
jgi:type IV secretory pathway protease TraF